jgi:hypothetical protein
MTRIPVGYKKVKPNVPWFEARKNVNLYLLQKVGSALMAGEPQLVDTEKLILEVPVIYSLPETGLIGTVGKIYVKADTTELLLDVSDSKEQIHANAERTYQEKTLSSKR